MDPHAKWGENTNAPVADFIAEAFDQNLSVIGDDARGFSLFVDVVHELLRGVLIERGKLLHKLRAFGWRDRLKLSQKLAHFLAEFERAAGAFSTPKRKSSRFAGCRRDENFLAGDIGHPPRGGTEHDRVAHARLVDHLLVELSEARATFA